MKTFTLLSLFVLLLLSQSVWGQSYPKSSVLFGVSHSSLYLYAPGDYRVYGDFSTQTSIWDNSTPSPVKGIGFSAGYSWQLASRWELSLRVGYSGNTVEERIMSTYGFSPSAGSYDYTFDRNRKYRAAWFEGLIFRRISGPHIKPDIQLGTGLTFLYHKQDYLSGFEFDLNRGIYDVRYFSTERKGNFGIPIHVQLQYPVSPVVKLGINTHANILFDGSVLTGLTAFATYRLDNLGQ